MRNLIPVMAGCLCLAAIVYVPVEPPGPDTVNTSGAWQKMRVKNAHEKEWRIKKKEMDSLKVKYDSVANGWSKGDLKAIAVAKASAVKAFRVIDKLYFYAQQDIEEYKTNHPAGFKQLGLLKDHNGKPMTVYVGRNAFPSDEIARTYWQYCPAHDQVYTVVEPDKLGDAFLVYIKPDQVYTGAILAHEKGHMMDIVKDPVGYWKDSAARQNMNCQELGSWSNRYVAPARDAEAEYNRESKNIYKRKVYGTSD